MTATNPAIARLTIPQILAAGEERLVAVLGGFRLKTRLKQDAAAAERDYRESLSAEDLERMVRAKANLAGIDIALSGDPESIAESERVRALNRHQTFEALLPELEDRLGEAERLIVGRRDELADAMAAYIRRGGHPLFLRAYGNTHDPNPVEAAMLAADEAETLIASLTGAISRCRTYLANGGVPANGNPVGSEIDNLIAVASREVPSH